MYFCCKYVFFAVNMYLCCKLVFLVQICICTVNYYLYSKLVSIQFIKIHNLLKYKITNYKSIYKNGL